MSNVPLPVFAGIAQLVEQLICNQQVGGSSPSTGSNLNLDKCIVKYIIIDNSVQNEYHRAENSILPAGAWNAKFIHER